MPVMGGHAASRLIRAMDRFDAASILIIALTANAFSEDIAAALAAGINEDVNKSIDMPFMQNLTAIVCMKNFLTGILRQNSSKKVM